MYAIIAAFGRQHKVFEGQELQIDYKDGMTSGEALTFDRVVAFSDGSSLQLGHPTLAGASVSAEVVAIEAGPKVVVQKARRRKNYRRRTGHRQMYARVKISKIQVG